MSSIQLVPIEKQNQTTGVTPTQSGCTQPGCAHAACMSRETQPITPVESDINIQ
jgi:hypothetical protein